MKTRLLKLALCAMAALPIGAWADVVGYDEVFKVDYAKIATDNWNVTSSTGSQKISRNTSVDKTIDNEKVYPFQVIKSESTILDYNEVYVASGEYYLTLNNVNLIGLRCTNSTATRIGIFDLQRDDIVEIATNGGNASNATPTESAPATPYNLSDFAKQDGTYGHTYVHTASRTARYYVYKATVSADGAVSFKVSNNCYIAYIKVLRPYTAYTLTTTASPAEGGSISGNDDASYRSGSVITLTATPNDGYVFTGWSGGADGTTNPLEVTMDADKTITATFAKESATTVWRFEQYVGTQNDDKDKELILGNGSTGVLNYNGLYIHNNQGHKIYARSFGTMSLFNGSCTGLTITAGKCSTFNNKTADASFDIDAYGFQAPSAGTVTVSAYSGTENWGFYVFSGTTLKRTGKIETAKTSISVDYETNGSETIWIVPFGGTIYVSEIKFVPFTAIATSTTLHISSAGYATFCSPYNLTWDSETYPNLKAYYVSNVTTSAATVKEITSANGIPACTGVIFAGEEGYYTLTSIESATAIGDNQLKANLADYILPADNSYNYTKDKTQYQKDADKYNYTLAAGPTFKHSSGSGTLAAGKAFLRTTTDVSARGLELNFDEGETTGISEIEKLRNVGNEKFFDLQGRLVAQPTRGLYIVNGKKVIIK